VLALVSVTEVNGDPETEEPESLEGEGGCNEEGIGSRDRVCGILGTRTGVKNLAEGRAKLDCEGRDAWEARAEA
jgi:hypothetical protein